MACLAMTTRPFYRWKSFWLGLLVLVFLGWGWERSTRYRDKVAINFENALHTCELRSGSGTTELVWQELPAPSSGWSLIEVETSPIRRRRWFAEAGEIEVGYWLGLECAYWLLALLFLILWSAWLFWHWKREQKKLTA